MGDFLSEYFETVRVVPQVADDLTPVAEDVMDHYRREGYRVSGTRLADGGWHISISEDEWFKAVLGLKTALNIRIEPLEGGTRVTAGIGIFELQVIPTLITLFVFTPVIFAQIYGILQQQKLDDAAARFIEDRLALYGRAPRQGDYDPSRLSERLAQSLEDAYPTPRRNAADEARERAEQELGRNPFRGEGTTGR